MGFIPYARLDTIWSYLKLSDAISSYLALTGATWSYPKLSGAIQSYLDGRPDDLAHPCRSGRPGSPVHPFPTSRVEVRAPESGSRLPDPTPNFHVEPKNPSRALAPKSTSGVPLRLPDSAAII